MGALEGNVNPNWPHVKSTRRLGLTPRLGFVSPPSCDLPTVRDYVMDDVVHPTPNKD